MSSIASRMAADLFSKSYAVTGRVAHILLLAKAPFYSSLPARPRNPMMLYTAGHRRRLHRPELFRGSPR
jgi:hypothetical protein